MKKKREEKKEEEGGRESESKRRHRKKANISPFIRKMNHALSPLPRERMIKKTKKKKK